MKKLILLCGSLLLTVSMARATVYSYTFNSGFANGGVIPDGNVAGWTDNRTVSLASDFGPNYRPGELTTIADINVHLTVSGGYNGDLYAYLVHSSGFVVLLNRSGKTGANAFGFSDPGFNVLFDDGGGDIHNYTPNNTLSPLTGTWAPDGRNIDPATVLDTDARTALLASLNGTGANGTWTLFLADMSGGSVSTITSWGLDITVVPEPTTWGMIIFGALAIGWQGSKYLRRRMTAVR